MVDISFLAHRQARISRLLKYLDEAKKKVREEFFEFANQGTPKHLLPTFTVSVPNDFFTKTDLSHKTFLETRFPAWNLIHTQENEQETIFVLLKDPSYTPYTYQDFGFELSRSISEITPEVDWDSMAKENHFLFEKFSKPVVSYELDADAFQAYVSDNPQWDAQGFLARHSIHKKPTLRVLSKVKTDG